MKLMLKLFIYLLLLSAASLSSAVSSDNDDVQNYQITAGSQHTCALDDNGVQCWGRDVYGQSTVPTGLVNPVTVAAGYFHTCAIDDNDLQCWGDNDYQQSAVPAGLMNSVAVAAGDAHTCALDDSGVQCWGDNNYGQSSVPSDLENPVAVAAGFYHTCAIDEITVTPSTLVTPIVTCWGWDDYGQSTVPSDLENPVAVVAGRTHTCALDDNGVQCWGYNSYWQSNVLANLMFDPDGDGVSSQDGLDAFPLDGTEDTDTDSDGIGNNADVDDDGDGVNDEDDALPLDPSNDSDSDGVANNVDLFPLDSTETIDSDSDGVGDNSDIYPNNRLYAFDSDGDGMPDAWERRYGLDPNDASDASSDQDNDGVGALSEFLAGTPPSGSIDFDGNGRYDALTDGLLLLRGMFGLTGDALISGTVASNAIYTSSVDIETHIVMLGDLADIDGNGTIDALTDGLLTLRYLFGLEGDMLISGVVAADATRDSAAEIEAHLKTLMPAL